MRSGRVDVSLTGGLGRCWLVAHKDNANHFGGVGVFCVGSFLYSVAFIRISALFEKHLRHLQIGLELFLLVSTVVLVIAFVALWFGEEREIRDGKGTEEFTRTAYIVEHAAYIAHLVFYGVFFAYNSPDLFKEKPERGYGIMDYIYDTDGGVETCKPLIQMRVLPRVQTVDMLAQPRMAQQ